MLTKHCEISYEENSDVKKFDVEMFSKVILSLVLVNLVVVGLVKGHLEQPVPNEALDQSLYEDVLDPEKCNEQINIIRDNPLLTMFCKYYFYFFILFFALDYRYENMNYGSI